MIVPQWEDVDPTLFQEEMEAVLVLRNKVRCIASSTRSLLREGKGDAPYFAVD